MSMFTLADPASDWEEVSRAPRSAAPCRCAGGDEIAYRDDDGDWTCIRCGRQVSYLMSLKSGAEGRGFNAFPDGEISRWD